MIIVCPLSLFLLPLHLSLSLLFPFPLSPCPLPLPSLSPSPLSLPLFLSPLSIFTVSLSLSFSQAIRLLESSRLKDSEEEELWTDALVKLYINLSLTNLKQKKPKCAITNCRRVLELKENNVKATFTLAKV